MIQIKVLVVSLFLSSALIAQQNPNPEVYYSQPKTIKEIALRSLSEVPDSLDIVAIFTPKYAQRAQYYFNVEKCDWRRQVAIDTINVNIANTKLIETQVWSYTPVEYCSRFSRKLDSLEYIFLNPRIKIHDIDRGDGSHWAYFARYRTFVNGHWICLKDLWGLLLAIHDSDLYYWKNMNCEN